jgi:transcriptional regulator with XRE-family HTH domain
MKRSNRPAKRPARNEPRAEKTATEATEAERMQIGGRLKHARMLSGVLMRELAEKVDCTESMISKIESGRVMPSLPMLQRIVDALGRDLASFFGSDPNSPGLIQRNGQRPVTTTDPIRKGQGVSYERLVPFGAGNLLEGNVHVIEPNGFKHDTVTHQGETVGFVLEGQVELTIETTTYRLSDGDSFFFKNHLTNSYRNLGPGTARIVWVNTPQVH